MRENILNLLQQGDTLRSYAGLPQSAYETEQRQLGVAASAWHAALRDAALSLLARYSPDQARLKIADHLWPLYRAERVRIQSVLMDADERYFCFTNDLFVKNIAILRHRLIPLGAEYACPFSGVPARTVLRAFIRTDASFLKTIACMGGRHPCLELHMHAENKTAFTPEGWELTFARLRDLLISNPGIRGILSTSWFLDPDVKNVSPHLGYLLQGSINSGASLLFDGYEDKKSGALQTSSSRRQAFEDGSYKPKRFTRLWCRKTAIRFFPQRREP